METKQTALDFLLTELDIPKLINREKLTIAAEIVRQAKAMEKEQIVKANRDGVDMVVDKKDFILGEQYYNETFGK